jgi:hypothetical protein
MMPPDIPDLGDGTELPAIYCRAREANEAFQAHAALLRAEAEAPLLRTLPSFTMAKQDAYEKFARAFARVG